MSGDTGVGKTTFAMNASHWLPAQFGPTCLYDGELTFDGLVSAVKEFAGALPPNNKRIIPINIDHRENAPPTDAELAVIKRFLRTNAASVPAIVFWPETSPVIAKDLSNRYVAIAGETSVPLPLVCEGPARDTWQATARSTLVLFNHVEHLEELGVNPDDYDPATFRTLGGFLRQLSRDFNIRVRELQSQWEKPVSVIIAFASETGHPGVLSQLTSPSRYGLLDGHALVSVTSQSEVGKWWSNRRGLLTKAIVQLDAHGICLAPTAAASCIRNFTDKMELFDEAGYQRIGPARGARDLGRSDLAKLVLGADLSRFEARGNPGEEATAAFQLLAERGFNLGKDKNLNQVMKTGLETVLTNNTVRFEKVTAEQKLPFCALIPDNAIYFPDRIQCVEYTWRKGDFLATGNRSGVAQYILEKLRAYVRQLGWTID